MTTDRLAAQFERGLNALLDGLVNGLAAPAAEGARTSRRNVRSPQGPATKNPRAD